MLLSSLTMTASPLRFFPCFPLVFLWLFCSFRSRSSFFLSTIWFVSLFCISETISRRKSQPWWRPQTWRSTPTGRLSSPSSSRRGASTTSSWAWDPVRFSCFLFRRLRFEIFAEKNWILIPFYLVSECSCRRWWCTYWSLRCPSRWRWWFCCCSRSCCWGEKGDIFCSFFSVSYIRYTRMLIISSKWRKGLICFVPLLLMLLLFWLQEEPKEESDDDMGFSLFD